MDTRIDPDSLYFPAEIAARLRCGKTNVYDLIKKGELAVTRIGSGRSGLRVKGSDLTAFLDARKEGGPKPKGRFKLLAEYLP
jgi:excisionase family DNA binding protein